MPLIRFKSNIAPAPRPQETIDAIELLIEIKEATPDSLGGAIIKRWEINGKRDDLIDMLHLMSEALPVTMIVCGWLDGQLVYYHTGKMESQKTSILIMSWHRPLNMAKYRKTKEE